MVLEMLEHQTYSNKWIDWLKGSGWLNKYYNYSSLSMQPCRNKKADNITMYNCKIMRNKKNSERSGIF